MLEAALAIGRWLQFSATMLLFGSPLFFLYGIPPDYDEVQDRRWTRRLMLTASLVALAAAIVSVMAQSAEMSGAASAAVAPDIVWTVVSSTQYGKVWLVRLTLVLASIGVAAMAPSVRRVWAPQVIIGAMLCGSLAWMGHGGAGEGLAGAFHRGADVAHLLAASVWLGALAPLAFLLHRAATVRTESTAAAARFGLARFSGMGIAVVSVLALTGLINSWFLIGLANVATALNTPYGVTLAIKLVAFAAMLVLAAINRFRLTPRFAKDLTGKRDASTSVLGLRRTVVAETVSGALVLLLVALLGVLDPPAG